MKFQMIGIVSALCGLLVSSVSGQGIPTNDSFDSPTELTGLPVVVTGANEGSTLEDGEPLPSTPYGRLTASVWYVWTAPISGVVSVDTLGSDFGTVLAVWSGNQLNELTRIASDVDVYEGFSRVTLKVAQGDQCRISVYGINSERGTLALRILNTGSISGTVFGADGSTPLQDASVTFYRWFASSESWSQVSGVTTGTQGTYEAIGLEEGYYKVAFYDDYRSREFYPEIPHFEAAKILWLVGGQSMNRIDCVLNDEQPDAHITGRVTRLNGAVPVRASLVSIYAKNLPNDKWYSFASGRTRDDGTYDIGNIGPGVYRVGFADENSVYNDFSPVFYKGASDVDGATNVFVAKNAIVKDIDGALLSNTLLNELAISHGTLGPAFNPILTNYGVDVAASVTSLTVTPNVLDERYAARVNGTFVAPGTASAPIYLKHGSNLITVEVNSNGGPSLRTYHILVNRGTVQTAALKSLVLNSGSLRPAFDPAITLYTVKVDNSVESITISPTAKSKGAEITVNGKAVASGSESRKINLNPGFNTIDVAVKSGTGSASMIYRIVITRVKSSDSSLLELVIKGKGVTVQPLRFSPGQLNYRVRVPSSTKAILVVPKSSFKSALVTIDGLKVDKKGRTVRLSLGKTVIRVLVTAQDGSRKIYRITANRGN